MHFDGILDIVGQFGPFQLYVFLLIAFSINWSYHGVMVPFVVMDMDHWCYLAELQNLSWAEQKQIAIPVDDSGHYSKCERYELSSLNDVPFDSWINQSVYKPNTTVS